MPYKHRSLTNVEKGMLSSLSIPASLAGSFLFEGSRLARRHTISKGHSNTVSKFYKQISNIPVFLIYGHACICAKPWSYPIANKIKCDGDDTTFSFKIPQNTFILSFSHPGEFTCSTPRTPMHLHKEVKTIRDYFIIHGPEDMNIANNEKSIFSNSRRACGGLRKDEDIMYPNPSFSFEPDIKGNPRSKNENGVFDISIPIFPDSHDFTNEDSLIPQYDNSKPKAPMTNTNSWNLENIIKRIYTLRNINSAIFINMGCLSPCSSIPDDRLADSIDTADELMFRGESLYKHIAPVLTGNELAKFKIKTPKSFYTEVPPSKLDPIFFREMLKSGLYDPEEFYDELALGKNGPFHKENVNEVRKIIKKQQNNNQAGIREQREKEIKAAGGP